MSKRYTWNKRHPHIMINDCGQEAKRRVRGMSNKELDNLLSENVAEIEHLSEILAWPRHKKIKFIMHCAMQNLANQINKSMEEAKGEEDAKK